MCIRDRAYSITHHTRQSAIGLPFISKKQYGGQEYSVTEYTMSEIVASVYDKMEETGLSEGILFIDEINCVSETLAPAMLQLDVYKRQVQWRTGADIPGVIPMKTVKTRRLPWMPRLFWSGIPSTTYV